MSICPRCRYEFAAGVLVCTDCNVSLEGYIDKQPTVAMVPDDSWVTVGKVDTGARARLAKGSLDSSNIPSVLLSSAFGDDETKVDSMALQLSSQDDRVILVPREFRDEAVLILRAAFGDDLVQQVWEDK